MEPRNSERLPDNSKFCVFAVLMTLLPCAFINGISLAVLNTAAPAIKTFINDTYALRYGVAPPENVATSVFVMVNSFTVWGSVPGALLVNPALQRMTRKNAVLLVHVISTISVLFMGVGAVYGPSYELLIAGRFIGGVARGLSLSLVMVVVAETTCRRKLGIFQSPYSVILFVSSAVGAAIGHNKVLGTPTLWMWAVSAQEFASIVYFCAYPWLPETPVYLLKMGKVEEALSTLRKLRVGGEETLELTILQKELEDRSQTGQLSFLKMMREKRLRLQFLVSVYAMNTQQFAGIQAILMYSDQILYLAGVKYQQVSFATIGLYLQVLLAFGLFIPLHRRLGSKKVLIIGLLITDCGYLVFVISHALHEQSPWTSYIALAAMLVVTLGLQLGPQLCMTSLPSELTTSDSRPTVAFYSGCVFWTLASFTSFVFPYSVEAWQALAYVPFAILSILITVISIFLIPETNNRTAAEIQASFLEKSQQCMSPVF